MTASKKSKTTKGEKLTLKQKKLVEALPTSDSVAEAGEKAGYACRQDAHRALKGIAERAPEVLERLGLTIEHVADKCLRPLLAARETKFFANAGIVLDTREVEALDIRIRAIEVWACLMGAYAGQKVKVSGVFPSISTMSATMNSTKQSPTSLSHLSRYQRVELTAALQERERRRCARDPGHWLFRHVKTQDEHDPSIAAKPFPDKEYLRWMVRRWLATRQNLWEKSRQMMASWTFCALYLHDTQFISATGGRRLNFIQSKKEEDSDALIRRCWFIYENQDDWLRAMHPAEYSYCHLRFYRPEDTERKLAIGELWGIPQGGDVLRQRTASGLFIDEGAFQDDLEASVRAAQPMLKEGGRIDIVSSAEPSYFQDMVEGRVK